FKPEFLNRVDEIVIFKSLTREALNQIVGLEIQKAQRRLAERKMRLVVDDAVGEFLGEQGYEPAYGARPLRRAVQRYLLDPLALEILEGKFEEGDTIHASLDGKGKHLVFRREESRAGE
ncbi:type VI secretion system ATPase TssH, partial [bacterium]|nr:type VI secretion system ATPase TssH [bacterium]